MSTRTRLEPRMVDVVETFCDFCGNVLSSGSFKYDGIEVRSFLRSVKEHGIRHYEFGARLFDFCSKCYPLWVAKVKGDK